MTHPALSLQAAIFSRLASDAPLVDLLMGEFIYDDVPPKKEPPYIVFAESTHNDWSTGTEMGMEHFVSMNVWSSQNGRKEALVISQQIQNALSQMDEEIEGHHLVNFSHEITEVERDEETEFFVSKLTFRAVTEPLI